MFIVIEYKYLFFRMLPQIMTEKDSAPSGDQT